MATTITGWSFVTIPPSGYYFRVDGRCDGILLEDEVTIEEIKSTTRDLLELNENSNPLHWAQDAMLFLWRGAKAIESRYNSPITTSKPKR